MVLSALHKSRHRGNTVDLYEFVYGDNPGDVFRYTSGERDLTLAGELYAATPIERDSIKRKGRERPEAFKVKVPRTSGIAGLFQGTPPRRVVFLRVFEGDIPEFDTPSAWAQEQTVGLIWSGRVLDAQHKAEQTVLSCNNLGVGMKRPGLFRNYQRKCGHVLYGERCLAAKAAATSQFQVVLVTEGRRISLPANWVPATSLVNYVGGVLEWDGPQGRESRVIVQATATYVVVDSPVTGLLAAGETVDVIRGCDRTLDTCRDIHSNAVNFGGQPWIPTSNPHGKNNHT